MTVLTDAFTGAARARAATLGLAALPVVVTRHPIVSRSRAELDEMVGAAEADIVSALTGAR